MVQPVMHARIYDRHFHCHHLHYYIASSFTQSSVAVLAQAIVCYFVAAVFDRLDGGYENGTGWNSPPKAARANRAPNPSNHGDMQEKDSWHHAAIGGQNCKVGLGIRLGK